MNLYLMGAVTYTLFKNLNIPSPWPLIVIKLICLSVETDLQVQNALNALHIHHDLLLLADALHSDTCIPNVALLLTCNVLVGLICSQLIEMCIMSGRAA